MIAPRRGLPPREESPLIGPEGFHPGPPAERLFSRRPNPASLFLRLLLAGVFLFPQDLPAVSPPVPRQAPVLLPGSAGDGEKEAGAVSLPPPDALSGEPALREEGDPAAAPGEEGDPEAEHRRLFEESLDRLLPLDPGEVRSYLERRDRMDEAASPLPARMRTRLRSLQPGLAGTPAVIRLTQGYSSTLLFQDATGAPWPLLSAVLGDAGAFALSQPGVPREARTDGEGAARSPHPHLLSVIPLRARASSSLVLTLEGAEYPVVLHLRADAPHSPDRVSDALTVFRVAGRGPAARDPVTGPPPQALSDDLLAFAHGLAPRGARLLRCSPDLPGVQVWAWKGKHYLLSPMQAVWPAWTAVAASDGRSLYELPATPSLVLNLDGSNRSLVCRGSRGSPERDGQGGRHGP